MSTTNFNCKNICGDSNFSINEWNIQYQYCNDAGIEGIERDKILNPELFPCENQYEDCINIVLDTKIKNKNL